MSTGAAIALGVGVGVVFMAPLIGVGAVIIADALCDWHWKRQGLGDWARRWIA